MASISATAPPSSLPPRDSPPGGALGPKRADNLGPAFATHLRLPAQRLPLAQFPDGRRHLPHGALSSASARSASTCTDSEATGRGRSSGGADDEAPRTEPASFIDSVDPLTRALSSLGTRSFTPLLPASPERDQPAVAASRVSLEQVLSRLVRRVAWTGDAHVGSARLELGAGALEGATLTIHSDHGALRVSLELPPGVDPAVWKERIARRLDMRGLQIASLEVE